MNKLQRTKLHSALLFCLLNFVFHSFWQLLFLVGFDLSPVRIHQSSATELAAPQVSFLSSVFNIVIGSEWKKHCGYFYMY